MKQNLVIIIILIITLFTLGGKANYYNNSSDIGNSGDNINSSLEDNEEDNASNDTNNIDDTIQYYDNDNLKVSIKTKSLGRDINWNAQKVLVNITINRLGNLTYLEEYSSVDSQMQPKFYSSKVYFESKLTTGNISFEILRPRKNRKTFILTKGIIILDGKRVYERWITSNISNYILIDQSHKSNYILTQSDKKNNITNINTNNINNVNNNINTNNDTIPNDNEVKRIFQISNTSTSKKTPGIGIGISITVLIFCFLFNRKKEKKDENK